MTSAKVLRQFFKHFFDIDAEGNSANKVLNDVIENNDSFPGGGSDGGVLNIMLTYDTEADDGTYVCDTTLEEMEAAALAGKLIVAQSYREHNGYGNKFIINYYVEDGQASISSGEQFGFGLNENTIVLLIYEWSVTDENVWSYVEGYIPVTVVG